MESYFTLRREEESPFLRGREGLAFLLSCLQGQFLHMAILRTIEHFLRVISEGEQ